MKLDPKMLYRNRQKEVAQDIMSWTDINIERIATSSLGTTMVSFCHQEPESSQFNVQTDRDKPIYTTVINNDKTFSCNCGYFTGKNKYLTGDYKKICKHLYLHSYFIKLTF
jgi:hypothetical protein